MDRLRSPFLVLSVVAVALAFLLSLGSELLAAPASAAQRSADALAAIRSDPVLTAQLAANGLNLDDARDAISEVRVDAPPGLAIPALAIVLGLLLLILVLTALPLVIGERATGLVQGITSVIGGLIGLLAGVVVAIAAFGSLLLMVSLLLSAPFGTLAYLAIYGSFDTATSSLLTSVIMALLVVGVVCLIVAQQRFLSGKGLMLLEATAVVLTLVVTLLHSIVPGLLVSITDAIGALVIGIIGAIWSLAILIGGLVGAIRVLQLGRQAS